MSQAVVVLRQVKARGTSGVFVECCSSANQLTNAVCLNWPVTSGFSRGCVQVLAVHPNGSKGGYHSGYFEECCLQCGPWSSYFSSVC